MEDIYALLNINKDLLQDFHLLAERTVDHQTELAISRNMRTLQDRGTHDDRQNCYCFSTDY